jgi:hypothetical protein
VSENGVDLTGGVTGVMGENYINRSFLICTFYLILYYLEENKRRKIKRAKH